jgi:voltage-gated potassium channel
MEGSAMADQTLPIKRRINTERHRLLRRIHSAAERPLAMLGFIWLALILIQLIYGYDSLINVLTWSIWVIFLIDTIIRFVLAPNKLRFVRHNWLVLISLVLPAFRFLRFAQTLTFLRTADIRLLRLLTGANRAMTALGVTMGRRGLKYVLGLTAITVLAGAAGMFAFERNPHGGPGLNTYGDSLWWTAMLMTTLGSDYFPHSAGGRILCLALAIFAFSVFGYITAAVASFFVDRDAKDREKSQTEPSLAQVLQEVKALREQVARLEPHSGGG